MKKQAKKQSFTVEQILTSKLFAKNRDVLRAILQKEKLYSILEVNNILENFKNGGDV